jgi:(1->4)-alpha-D-glucan 1-alpha-D-glucosylmutase
MIKTLVQPRSVYRPYGLTFSEIQELVIPYIAELGVDGLFLDPVLSALSYQSADRRSWHGYDRRDNDNVAPERGGIVAFDSMMNAAQAAGLSTVIDVVPNHTTDQHPRYQQGSDDYDWFTVNGERRCGNFFGLGWLPRLKVQDKGVFDRTMGYMLKLAAQYKVAILRRDHGDGVAYPKQVARWMTEALRALGSDTVVVDEKIVQVNEALAQDSATDGETGYKPLTLGNLVSHNLAGVEKIRRQWQVKTGNTLTDVAAAKQCKYEAAHQHFPADLERMVGVINTLADAHGQEHITADQLADMLSTMPVYRIYPEPGQALSAADQAALAHTTLPQWYQAGLIAGDAEFVTASEPLYPLMSAIFAKGVEDRMFYRQTPLASLREVGGAMDMLAVSVGDYHQRMIEWTRSNPNTWATTMTHDTKRSLGSRARLAACSWVADEYLVTMDGLSAAAAKHKPASINAQVEDFIYQTLISVWPFPVERLLKQPSGDVGYFGKAFREKCVETSWFNNNQQFEADVDAFVSAIVNDSDFLAVLEPFCQKVSKIGVDLALNQQLLKLFAANVADFFHGAEGANDYSLVDPDNRLAKDYKALLEQLRGIKAGQPVTDDTKMLNLVYTVLQARKRFPEAMESQYEVVDVGAGKLGIRRGNLVAVMAIDPSVSDVSNDVEGETLLDYGRQVVKLVD